MNQEIKNCQNCKKDFVIEPDDFAFYEKMKVPPPTWCPDCRLQRRLNWQGYRILYKRKCDFCKKEKPDLLILNGDTLDCFQLSRFDKDPKKRSFAGELDIMKSLIQVFEKVLKCKIIFKKGNHSERYEQFLRMKAKELIGVEEFELNNIINARVNGIDVIGDKRIIHANKLNIIHGHEFSQGFFSPVNVARGLALRAKASAIQGHNHQSSEHTSIDINGKVMTTWSTGALCQLHPQYAPINNWNLGFAVIDLDSNGEDFNVRNKRIYKGKIL